ncbi:TPA: hypothetical protein JLS53_004828, partial [Escherichia coli]|nr:hypothetical protein [Escherichia coli]
HARLEIITGLFNRLQKTLRAMPPDDRDNLPLLYQTETFLKALSDTLARYELKQSSKVALPEAMVKGYITRLENQPVQGEASSPVTLPAQALRSDARDVQEHQPLPHSRLVYVVSETKAGPTPSLQKSPPTFLKPFVTGVCAALPAVSVAIPGWQYLTQPSPAEQQLRALLTPPPDVLSADQMTQLSRTPSLLNHASEWISELKTEVFGIMQAFNRHIPAEEQLRRYDEARNQNGSEQQQKQAEMALNQLINRYQVEHAGKPERQP